MAFCRDCGAELTDEAHVCPARDKETDIVQTSEVQSSKIVSKKNWDAVSIIGFCVSLIAPAILVPLINFGADIIMWFNGDALREIGIFGFIIYIFELGFMLICSVYVSALVGMAALTLSAAGFAIVIVRHKRGLGFAIAGIAISLAYLLFIIIKAGILAT